MTSEPIRRGRDERWISLERWWAPPEVTVTSKSVRFSAAAPIAAKCVRRQHMQPSKDRRYSHLVGAGEQRWRDDEAKRVLAPGYKDKRQALIYPLFYVLLATKDIARSVRPRVSK